MQEERKNKKEWLEGLTESPIELRAMLPAEKKLEEEIVGEMIESEEARSHSLSKLDNDDFYHEDTRHIFEAIRTCFVEHGDQIDGMTVVTQLKKMGKLDAVGGGYYVTMLIEKALSPFIAGKANKSHVAELLEITQSRNIVKASLEAIESCYQTLADPRQIGSTLMEKLMQMHSAKSRGWQSVNKLVEQNVLTVEKLRATGMPPGVPTGFHKIDDVLGGLRPRYIIIGGRTTLGKSALAAGISRNIVRLTGRPVGIFSLEMGEEMIANREIAAHGKVSVTSWSTFKLSNEEVEVVKDRLKVSEEDLKKLHVDTTPGLSIIEMYAKLRQLLIGCPDLAAAVIDYAQLMVPGIKKRFDNRQMEMSFVSQRIQQIVKITNLPIIVVCQISREAEKSRGKKPTLAHLRESGNFEMDSDVVMLLFRRSYYFKDWVEKQAENNEMVDVAELHLAKNKDGPTGYIELGWNGPRTEFMNLKEGGEVRKRKKKELGEDEPTTQKDEEEDENVGRTVVHGEPKKMYKVGGKESETPF